MYLWCAKCNHAHLRTHWILKGAKYGVCPSCGCSEYRNALDWDPIAKVNDYPPEPNRSQVYPPYPVLFNVDEHHIIK
jgi:hypothetical protein